MKTASLTVALTALVVLAASSTEATRVGAGAQASLATSAMAQVRQVTEAPPAKEDKDMESEAEIKEKAAKMTEECKKQAERDHKLSLNRLAGTYKTAIERCITDNKPRCPAARRNCKVMGLGLPSFLSSLYPDSLVKSWCKGDFCEQYGSCSGCPKPQPKPIDQAEVEKEAKKKADASTTKAPEETTAAPTAAPAATTAAPAATTAAPAATTAAAASTTAAAASTTAAPASTAAPSTTTAAP